MLVLLFLLVKKFAKTKVGENMNPEVSKLFEKCYAVTKPHANLFKITL
jgi:hypothetical protein